MYSRVLSYVRRLHKQVDVVEIEIYILNDESEFRYQMIEVNLRAVPRYKLLPDVS